MLYRSDLDQWGEVALPDFLRLIGRLEFPGSPDEWNVLLARNGVLLFFRKELASTDPDEQESVGWLRGYLDLVTGECEISGAPAGKEVGTMFEDILLGAQQSMNGPATARSTPMKVTTWPKIA